MVIMMAFHAKNNGAVTEIKSCSILAYKVDRKKLLELNLRQ
jgi:hypothetical protein